MGWLFELRDANIAAYLTRPISDEPPRMRAGDLVRFLGALEHDTYSLISSKPFWVDRVSAVAGESSRSLDRRLRGESWQEFLSPPLIKEALADLRRVFKNFELYALVASRDHESYDRVNAFFRHAAYTTEHNALILMPHGGMGQGSLEFFDPIPPVQQIASHPENLPGVLFWLKTGESAFAPVRDAEPLFRQLVEQLDSTPAKLEQIMSDYNRQTPDCRRSRILHLSDLHFGSRDALKKEPYLERCLLDRKNDFDRVVISGDLFDNPRSDDYAAFYRFLTSLRNWNAKDPVIVPGNHDQRAFGNNLGRIGEEYRQLANMKWGPGVVVDDDLLCTFLCFNSSEKGNWARGGMSDSQLREVATELQIQLGRREELNNYERIAVLHHHPFPYAPEELPVQRGRKRLFVGNERYIQMEDSDRFLSWCAARRTSLILHGHKHVARHRAEIVRPGRVPPMEITAVGCGTSLGIGGKPLSYNIVSWTPGAESWSASFFSDPGDGSGFHQDYLTLYRSSSREIA
ncbi:metallophosphoesterase family protein [Streptomyces pseudovenezuelae]|uniref:metallophosphoesterase family protein n=1 Tax=Streptomyces pseudovenezuelae TaxID=67350 RepID=UPI003721490E